LNILTLIDDTTKLSRNVVGDRLPSNAAPYPKGTENSASILVDLLNTCDSI
jgi:hypothetical protein